MIHRLGSVYGTDPLVRPIERQPMIGADLVLAGLGDDQVAYGHFVALVANVVLVASHSQGPVGVERRLS